MPRTGRFTVEFDIDGKTWEASFTHRHAKESCPHQLGHGIFAHVVVQCSHYDKKGRPQHDVWSCPQRRTRVFCPEPKVEGIEYTIDHGDDLGKVIRIRHLTTVRLRHKGTSFFLSGTAPCSLADEYNWHKGLHYALQRALSKGGYCTLEKRDGRVVVASKKPIYDEVCEAFWREMRLKPAKIIETPPPQGAVPPAHTHGMGWAGMD